MLVWVSKYSYFSISYINCYNTSQYMKFFNFDFFEDFDLAKLILTQNSNSKHLQSIFLIVRVSKYSYLSISHINCYYTSQYMKFFKFDFFEDFDLAKLILTQNSNSKHLESTFRLLTVSWLYRDLRYEWIFLQISLTGQDLHPWTLSGP